LPKQTVRNLQIVGAMEAMGDDYNRHSRNQQAVWLQALPLFDEAAKGLIRPEKTHAQNGWWFRVADMGCSTGGNSVTPLRFLWRRAQQQGAEGMHVLLNDVLGTYWRETMQTVTPEALACARAPDGNNCERELALDPLTVFVHAVGRSFYEKVAPPQSLDLAYSLVAVHWMSELLSPERFGCYATDPLHVPDTASLLQWRSLGARDWEQFLTARSVELVPGGKLVVVLACQKNDGDYPWSQVGYAFYSCLEELMQAGRLTEAELADYTLPCCWRSREDVEAPIQDKRVPFKIDRLEHRHTPCVSREALRRGEIDPDMYAVQIMDAFLAVGARPLLSILVCSRSQQEAETIVAEARELALPIVRGNPDKYQLDMSFWHLLATRLP